MTKVDTTVERVGGYRVVRRLATGGTSDVLLAKAEGPHGFERTVVLKLLLSQFRNDEDFARMFAREASAYARLSHPAIVQLFDFFSVPGPDPSVSEPEGRRGLPEASRAGQLCMVLEHVDGPPLARLRTMLKGIGKELEDQAALYVAARIFDALAAAHSALDDAGLTAPVIHRDVNPSNVLVPWDGHAKLADFGVAKVTGLNHQSVAGMIKGTYGYMAPEQVTGESVTPRADVYAGAIILWELLTKRRAFQRGALPEIEALRAMAEPRLPPIESVRPDLDRTVRDALKRALEPRADRRTITAEEMVSILSAAVPFEEGRERLVQALSTVKNSSQAAMGASASGPPGASPSFAPAPRTTPGGLPAPPVTVQGLAPPAPATSGRGILPKPAAPPRPASVPRLPAAHGPPEPPKPPNRAPLPPTALYPKPLSPNPPKVGGRAAKTLQSPTASTPEPARSPSASARLAVVTEPSKGAAPSSSKGAAPSSSVSIFDSLVEPPEPVKQDAAEVKVIAPLEALSPGKGLSDAIDEILRGQPTVAPGASDPPVRASTSSSSPPEPGTAVMVDAIRAIGQIPAAPPPMTLTGSGPPPPTPGFGAAMRELVEKAEAPTVAPPADVAPPPPTPRMQPVASLTTTLAMGARVDAPGDRPTPYAPSPAASAPSGDRPTPYAPPPAASAPSAPEPTYTPAAAPAPRAAAPDDVGRSASLPSMSDVAGVAEPGAGTPKAPRRSRTGAIVAVVVVALLACVAGAAAFLRFPELRGGEGATRPAASGVGATTGATATTAPSAAPAVSVGGADAAPSESASATASALPSASAAASASASATASANAAASASASASASPSATASAAASATTPPEAIPEGMGVLSTSGTAPGRRIFVDERTLGQTPESVTVACGKHSVQLGSSGKPQTIEVPCGAEVTVSDKF